MQKKADNRNLNIALLSLLTGAGTYAGMRGYREFTNTMNPEDPTPNQLDLTLPKSKVPKIGEPGQKMAGIGQWVDNSIDMAAPFAIGAAGLYGGFKGAQGLHSHFAGKELDEEREKVKQQYLAALQRAATKTASVEPETPAIDNIINGFLDKKAEFFQDRVNDFLSGAKNVGQEVGNAILDSKPASVVGAGGFLTGGAAALATYYLANRLDRNKAEANHKSQIPTEIKLHVK